jgi:hypothetical protein
MPVFMKAKPNENKIKPFNLKRLQEEPMKTLIFYFVLIALSFQSFGQEMVKVNIIAYYDQVPAPPPDVKAAYQRLTCVEENMSLQCSAEKFYQPIVSDLAGIKQQLEQLNIALAMPVSSGMQNMNPEEIQKKMAAMTQEEQMQFAMEMSQQMMNTGMNNMPESDEVLAAIEEHGQLATQIATEFQNPSETSRKRTALARERERKHQEVNTWFKAEFDKLPLVSFGEVGKGPGPKAEYTLKVASMEKHIAVENEYL